MLVLTDVCFSYGKKEIIKNISLRICEGEFIGVLGANGSGKTTMVKLLNALLIPTSGEVVVDDCNTKNKDSIWDIRQKVGMVFQNPDNQIVATIVENDVAFVLENLGFSSEEIQQRVAESLKIVHLYEKRRFAPHNLSGGEKQRLALASIIAMRPKYIIFDEPTSMLDPRGRQDVMELIHRLRKEYGITVIMITHFMEEVVDCDRIIVMNSGKIAADDKPAKILTDIKLLKKLSLEPPPATMLAQCIKETYRGFHSSALTMQELVEEICMQYKPKT